MRHTDTNETLIYDHVRIKPTEQIRLHSSNSWEMTYIISGSGERIIGGTREKFKAGEIWLIVPGMPHQWIFNPDDTDSEGNIENITIIFPTDLPERLARLFPEYGVLAERYGSMDKSVRFGNKDCEFIGACLRRMENETAAERMSTLIFLLTAILKSRDLTYARHHLKDSSPAEKAKQIKTFINCNFPEDITIDMIAAHMKMNRGMVCSTFKRQTGTTIISYLTKRRVREACDLLMSKRYTVAECCYKSGFNDVPHFNRVFRKMTGMTPNQFRKQNGVKGKRDMTGS